MFTACVVRYIEDEEIGEYDNEVIKEKTFSDFKSAYHWLEESHVFKPLYENYIINEETSIVNFPPSFNWMP